MPTENTAATQPMSISFHGLPTLFASQFMLSAGDEQVMLDCSPGVMIDPTTGCSNLPIQTRLAMSWQAAERLRSLLTQALQQRETMLKPTAAAPTKPVQPPMSLPQFPRRRMTTENATR